MINRYLGMSILDKVDKKDFLLWNVYNKISTLGSVAMEHILMKIDTVVDEACFGTYDPANTEQNQACAEQTSALMDVCLELAWQDEQCGSTFSQIKIDNVKAAIQLQNSLMSETGFQPQGFDYTAAGIGASVGFVAAYAILRAHKRKKRDDFERV